MEGTIATIMMFGGNFAPKNWAFCAGQLIAISQNTALFSLLGTNYGGNGTTTFALPDLRSRVAVGAGQGPGLSDYVLGEMAGIEHTTLFQGQMAAHTHTAGAVQIPLSNNNATLEEANGNILATPSAEIYATPNTTPAVSHPGLSATLAPQGGNQPISLMKPYECINFVICMYGVYPSRG
jgi:microcystin-dependent protein